jgi:hypothetical protein
VCNVHNIMDGMQMLCNVKGSLMQGTRVHKQCTDMPERVRILGTDNSIV